jgi:hypothetical protein
MGIWNGPPHEQRYECGAYARSADRPCRQFAMKNGRCYLHGGKSTGAINPHRPIKHGRRTKKAIQERQELAKLLKSAARLI